MNLKIAVLSPNCFLIFYMNILIRLPNWLGDTVMSVAFVQQVRLVYPNADISLIAKKGIHDLLPYFPPVKHSFVFSKAEYKGVKGIVQFGRNIKRTQKFDLFFTLPDSFSAALMGYAAGAGDKVGFKKEWRNLMLTHSYTKPQGLHRVDEYLQLLQSYTGKSALNPEVRLTHTFEKKDHIVVNINSEAQSRRLTVPKAVEELNLLRQHTDANIVLIGAPKERAFIEEVIAQLHTTKGFENVAGKTTLPQLVEVLASARVMLSTDSGPAHLANALGTHTVVLFGAGNEANTAPYNKELRTIIRLNKLSCEPCLKNVCARYEVPQCLQQLSTAEIIAKTIQHI